MTLHSFNLMRASRHLCILGLLSVVPLGGAQAPNQSDGDFLKAEQAVRHEFMLAHPYEAPGPLGKIYKKMDQDQLFVLSFVTIMYGQTSAPTKERHIPSYLEKRVAVMFRQLPFGSALQSAFLNRGEAGRIESNEAAIDKTAQENMQNFKQMAAVYQTATAEEFDRAKPIERVRYVLDALTGFEDDIHPPCPFTVYMLDAVEQNKEDYPDTLARDVGSTLGMASPEYLNYRTYSRAQKTAVIMKAYRAFLDSGRKTTATPNAENLSAYLAQSMHNYLIHDGSQWILIESNGTKHPDRDLILDIFGKQELESFSKLPSGAEKDATRVAAIVLWTQFRFVVAGLMVI